METLSKHFREITKAAFARYGFAQADVVANWDAIVGEELAAVFGDASGEGEAGGVDGGYVWGEFELAWSDMVSDELFDIGFLVEVFGLLWNGL